MKKLILVSVIVLFTSVIISCKKDEGEPPEISFKSGGSYTSSNTTLTGGSSFTIGINASKAEKKDVLKKFDITRSVDGGTGSSVYSKDLSGSEGDNYSYDYTATLDTIHGETNKYTFTVTNRDGIINQVSLTVTVQ